MSFALQNLPWLLPAPADVRQKLRSLEPEAAGTVLPQIASYRLTAEQAASFGNALSKARRAGASFPTLSNLKLGLLSNATFDLVADQLPAGAARHGVDLELVLPPFDQVQQQAMDSTSMINASGLDAVLLAVDHRWLQLDHNSPDAVQRAVDLLTSVVSALTATGKKALILQTIPTPPSPLFGSLDRRQAGSLRANVQAVNERIVAMASESGAYLFDVAALAERMGTDQWFDPVQWASFKLPFSSSAIAAYADALGSLLGAMRGKSRKCLVLDLDNTLWGGVIGDDGIANIKIGQGSAMGEAFVAIQAYALALRARGIMLAVSSKNDDANARLPFREHPDMLLKEEHITVFQANWTDKASNLEAIARTLNIGIDALVFLDDNPAERAQMRAALPMVGVPELPGDPNWYPWFLASAGYFEAIGFSAEDKLRVESYASEAKRAAVMASSRDLGDYLLSLGMEMKASPFDSASRARITQLINKTNQFNLTTRRYTEAEVIAVENTADAQGLQFRLRDSFGDFGMIGVIIASEDAQNPRVWTIDTWLMSCRVLGRKVEEAMLSKLVAAARASNVERIVGVYKPTAKNGMVQDHYSKLGFGPLAANASNADDSRSFELMVADFNDTPNPIRFE